MLPPSAKKQAIDKLASIFGIGLKSGYFNAAHTKQRLANL